MTTIRDHDLSRRAALLLFAVVVVSWGVNWSVTKTLVESVPALWTTAIRSAIGAAVLLFLLAATGRLILPRRGDLPVVFTVALFHMVAFSSLVSFGLLLAPVGRSIVLGYTTPLWVAPGAWLLIGERMTRARLAGVGLGLVGLAVMFNPLAADWNDQAGLVGNGLILLAALCWAVSIVYVRAHRWISAPFQLVFWQSLLASAILTAMALVVEGPPKIEWTPTITAGFLYGGFVGNALAYWAMTMVNRSLPAVTTSLGILGTPVVGVIVSMMALGEPLSVYVVVAMLLIIGGIALGTIPRKEAGNHRLVVGRAK